MALSPDGRIRLTGNTNSTDMGADMILAAFSLDLGTLEFGSYLGAMATS